MIPEFLRDFSLLGRIKGVEEQTGPPNGDLWLPGLIVPAREMSGVQHAAVVDAPLRGAVAPGATQVSHRQDEIRDARHDLGPKA